MRTLTTIVVAAAILSGIDNAFGQRFLDQLESVLDAESKAAQARAAQAEAKANPETPELAQPGYLGLIAEEASGTIRVERVRDDTAAQRAGIQVGDIIRRFGERDVATLDAMGDALAGRAAGERIVLSVQRGEKQLELSITLGARPKLAAVANPPAAKAPPAEVRFDALDALVELERLLDEETPPEEPGARPIDETRRKRIAEFEGQLELIQRRIAELEREIAELAAE